MPTELDDIARKIMQKEIAETALKRKRTRYLRRSWQR